MRFPRKNPETLVRPPLLASLLPRDDTTQDFVKNWVMGSDLDMKDSPSSKDLMSQRTTKDQAAEWSVSDGYPWPVF